MDFFYSDQKNTYSPLPHSHSLRYPFSMPSTNTLSSSIELCSQILALNHTLWGKIRTSHTVFSSSFLSILLSGGPFLVAYLAILATS